MRHRRWYERVAQVLLPTAVAIGVILTLGHLFRPADLRSRLESRTSWDAIVGLNRPASATLRRPTFDYSVIPGGVSDAQDLQRAVKQDPVVADHYRDADMSTMRPQILSSDQLAFVSYRVGDHVFWTKHRVRIRSGETIFANGQTEIRARCGNCISMEPLLPTSDDEPDEAAFDALTDTGPVLVAWNWTEFRPALMDGALLEDAADSAEVLGERSLPTPLFPFGTSLDDAPAASDTPATSPPGAVPDLPSLDGPIPPGGFADSPPGGMLPPGSLRSVDPVDNPGGPGVLVFEPLLPNSSIPPGTPRSVPPETSPVPEPGTFLLLGGGIAGLLARRVAMKRARARSSSIAS